MNCFVTKTDSGSNLQWFCFGDPLRMPHDQETGFLNILLTRFESCDYTTLSSLKRKLFVCVI